MRFSPPVDHDRMLVLYSQESNRPRVRGVLHHVGRTCFMNQTPLHLVILGASGGVGTCCVAGIVIVIGAFSVLFSSAALSALLSQ